MSKKKKERAVIVTTEQEFGVAHCLHGHKWVSPPVVCPYCEIASLRSGYLTDEHGNEYVQVCILKEKIREQEAEIERLKAAQVIPFRKAE